MQHQIFGAVERAKQALRAKDVDTALVHLKSADAAAAPAIAAGTQRVNALRATGTPKARAEANTLAVQVNEVVTARRKVRDVLSNFGEGGAPHGAGLFARVPLYLLAASNNVLADSEWIHLDTVATDEETGQSPDLPYLDYRIHGFVANAPRVGADIIVAEDLKAKGFPNIFLGEGPVGLQSYDGSAALLGGLRNKPAVKSPNRTTCTFQSYAVGDGATQGAASVDLNFEASLVVEILHDEAYGDINSLAARRSGSPLLGSSAAPGAGWVERIPMIVKTTDAFNLTDEPQVKLGWDDTADSEVNSVLMESEDIPYQDAQVVGLETEYVEGVDATYPSIVLLEDFKVKGGSSLFAQEDKIAAWNFLGDASEFHTQYVANTATWRSAGGWGLHKRPALRHYPKLDPTNRIQLTVSAKNKIDSDGALGANGSGIIAYCQAWALVNRLHDEIFGAPGGAIEAMLQALE